MILLDILTSAKVLATVLSEIIWECAADNTNVKIINALPRRVS